jgi:hypothetical protein
MERLPFAVETISRTFTLLSILWLLPISLIAQQHPLNVETASFLPERTARLEFGVSHLIDQPYPLSGLVGNLTKIGNLRLIFSINGDVEIEAEGTMQNVLRITERHSAYNSSIAARGMNVTNDFGDLTVWTKIALFSEYRSPIGLALRFGTQLPNASNESGLGLDEFNFFSSLLWEKHFFGIRFLANTGLGIYGDPTKAGEQHDNFIFAFGVTTPIGEESKLILETAGRFGHEGMGFHRVANMRSGIAFSVFGLQWKVLGILGTAPSDLARGFEVSAGNNFHFLKD